ncbi:MAG: ferritin family protein [Chloroflexi bacterium]|nr:ferritin family protein [Chloroflexota bacterium]
MPKRTIGEQFLELAIEIEKNGRAFYETVAQRSGDKKVQDVFTQLAAREKEHENTFRTMLNHLGDYQPAPEYTSEHHKYIKDIADSSVFTGERAQDTLARKTMTDIEAAQIGIGFEKDSILFYSEVRGMLPRQQHELIDMIVNEEKGHLSELTYIANKLKGG